MAQVNGWLETIRKLEKERDRKLLAMMRASQLDKEDFGEAWREFS
jgi:hypothetical protein